MCSNFKSINFTNEKFNLLKDVIISLYSKKKTIENLNIRTTLLNSEYKGIVLEIIDKSILLHAPFLKNKSNINLIIERWKEYLEEYLRKKDTNIMKKEAIKLKKIICKKKKNSLKKFFLIKCIQNLMIK